MSKNGSKRSERAADLARIDAEAGALAEALKECEQALAAVLLERDTRAPGAIVAGDDKAKLQLSRINERVHSLRLDAESYRAALTHVEAQRAGVLAALDELQKQEQRAALRELLQQRTAILADLLALVPGVGSQFVHLSECQQQISALRFNLGEADRDWRTVARQIEEAIAFATMANPSLRSFHLDSIEFGQGRAHLREIMAAEDVVTA